MSDLYNKQTAIPQHLGEVVDKYREVRDLRLAMQSETDEVEDYEKALKQHLIDTIPKTDQHGVVGKFYVAKIETKTEYRCTNWSITHSWIRRNDRFDMLQKRLTKEAVSDWMAGQGTLPPGIEMVLVPGVSVTKR